MHVWGTSIYEYMEAVVCRACIHLELFGKIQTTWLSRHLHGLRKLQLPEERPQVRWNHATLKSLYHRILRRLHFLKSINVREAKKNSSYAIGK
ncbi:hypothetical protein YC2023_013056 [Brassica napus]